MTFIYSAKTGQYGLAENRCDYFRLRLGQHINVRGCIFFHAQLGHTTWVKFVFIGICKI